MLTPSRLAEAFDAEGIEFGGADDPAEIYTSATALWAFLLQILFTGEQRSCQAGVARVAAVEVLRGRAVSDTHNSQEHQRQDHSSLTQFRVRGLAKVKLITPQFRHGSQRSPLGGHDRHHQQAGEHTPSRSCLAIESLRLQGVCVSEFSDRGQRLPPEFSASEGRRSDRLSGHVAAACKALGWI